MSNSLPIVAFKDLPVGHTFRHIRGEVRSIKINCSCCPRGNDAPLCKPNSIDFVKYHFCVVCDNQQVVDLGIIDEDIQAWYNVVHEANTDRLEKHHVTASDFPDSQFADILRKFN